MAMSPKITAIAAAAFGFGLFLAAPSEAANSTRTRAGTPLRMSPLTPYAPAQVRFTPKRTPGVLFSGPVKRDPRRPFH